MGTALLLGEKRTRRGEHRTEVTEATEGDFGAMVRAGFGWLSSLLGGKHTFRREHRTEVTEATERGFWGRWSERALGGRRRFWAGNTRFGESIAQRSGERTLLSGFFGSRRHPPAKSGIMTFADL